MQSCRRVFDRLDLSKGENASLLMARYVKNLDDNNVSKLDLYEAMKDAAFNAKPLYTQAFKIRHDTLRTIAISKRFRTVSTLIAGLGSSNVLETGLALNPTYGMPMIPASSIKGITAHYCSQVFGADNQDYRGPDHDNKQEGGKIYEILFGKVYPNDEQEAGLLQFYDAWLIPESVNNAFADDVMTPHHSDYYSGKSKLPTDFDDPNPVMFLSVNGTFEFWIGCNYPEWSDFGIKIMEEALKNYGIGGKISSGYGKMESVLSAEEVQERAKREAQQINRNAGFLHDEGDTVEVICTKIKVVKGKEKREFAFADGGDKKAVRFETPPKVDENTKFQAKIIRINMRDNAYIMQTI